jgi:hypothetical protein
MLTRRELVTGTALGALATTTSRSESTAAEEPEPQDVDNAAIRRIAEKTTEIDQTLDNLSSTVRSNSLAFGFVPRLRDAFTLYWKSHGKMPEFCEIGVAVFYDIYDWHVKNQLAVPVSRFAENRMAITFMFTLLLVRLDQADNYVGIPFDRQ